MNKISQILSPVVVYHPFLFAIFPVLFLFAHNIDECSFGELPLPMAIVLGITILLFYSLRLVFRDAQKAGLIASFLVIICLSYGQVARQIIDWRINEIVLGRNRYLLSACLLLFLTLLWFVKRGKKSLNNITKTLNFISIILLLITGGNLLFFFFREGKVAHRKPGNREDVIMHSESPDQLRDIYYIIFDRYAGDNTLRDVYHYDNKEFIDYLTKKGFYVARKSRANYNNTTQSLSSAFNLRYINDFFGNENENSRNWRLYYPLLENFEVQRFLKKKGYKYLHFGGLNDTTRKNPFADENYNLTVMSDLALMIYQNSIIPLIPGVYKLFNPRHQQWERIRYQFKELARVPHRTEPTFTFAHFILPHPPFIFDRDGSFLPAAEASRRGKVENYCNQLVYANSEIKKLVETILIDSAIPPVIIIQGDEGPWPQRYEKDCNYFDWREATAAELQEKFGILNAYYFPGDERPRFYPSITPVNSFRLIFNSLFKTRLPILPDKSYSITDAQHPFRLFEVTKSLLE